MTPSPVAIVVAAAVPMTWMASAVDTCSIPRAAACRRERTCNKEQGGTVAAEDAGRPRRRWHLRLAPPAPQAVEAPRHHQPVLLAPPHSPLPPPLLPGPRGRSPPSPVGAFHRPLSALPRPWGVGAAGGTLTPSPSSLLLPPPHRGVGGERRGCGPGVREPPRQRPAAGVLASASAARGGSGRPWRITVRCILSASTYLQ